MTNINRASNIKDNTISDNIYGMKKLSYWDMFKAAHCMTRRDNIPCLHQTIDGTVVLRNNLIRPVINQFHGTFKACIERRQRDEQQLLNIRFPDKMCNQYLEYLEHSDPGMLRS